MFIRTLMVVIQIAKAQRFVLIIKCYGVNLYPMEGPLT